MSYRDLTHLSPDDAQAAMKAATKKGHKYRAQKTEYGGVVYDSKAEANYAQVLDIWKAAGEISEWKRNVSYVLQEKPRIVYRPDFVVLGGRKYPLIVVDVKGVETAAFRLKAKLFVARWPAIPLIVVKRDGKGWREYRYGEKRTKQAVSCSVLTEKGEREG